jgi:cytochrome d ubiquinol oxidase subunit I
MYTLVFGAGSYYILKLIGKGIPAGEDKEQFYGHSIEATVTEAATEKGSSHV